MHLALSPQCPVFAPEHRVSLHAVLGTVVRRWHYIVVPQLGDLQAVLEGEVWETYGEYLVQAVKLAANGGHALVRPKDCTTCDPVRLANYCLAPAVIVVENVETDGQFLKCVIARLRPALASALTGTPPRLDVRQAGGIGEIPKELRRQAEREVATFPPERAGIRRVMGVADSDAPAPGALSDSAKALQQASVELGLKTHILSKRTIENYIPDAALLQYFRRGAGVASEAVFVADLAPPARDHYPLKSGLKRKELRAYRSQYPPDTEEEVGLGDFIGDLLTRHWHLVSAQDLEARDGSSELEDLLDLIEEHL